jgi:hypothetical protein
MLICVLLIPDVAKGFELAVDSELVVDYSMELTCTASKYKYRDNIQWFKGDQQLTESKGKCLKLIHNDYFILMTH